MYKSHLHNILILVCMVTFILSSCKYNNEEDLYPETKTDSITYTNDIKPIIDLNCISCHNNQDLLGGISLEDYINVSTAGQIPVGAYGSLYGAISWATENSPMPKDANKLNENDILKVKKWIDTGMGEN
ncbi:hypothetical protein ACFLRY_01590 [Bacteroidota bacterium]